MIAIREYATVKDHQIHINLPDEFGYDEVEVIIMPRSKIDNDDIGFLEEKERLQQSRKDIKSGKVKLLSLEQADKQMEDFLSEL